MPPTRLLSDLISGIPWQTGAIIECNDFSELGNSDSFKVSLTALTMFHFEYSADFLGEPL